MRKDRGGYYYFADRAGDTFRWKGENVSTMELAETIGAFPGVIEAVAYGVSIPGTDGRAGMAAIAVDADFDLISFHKHLVAHLPAYARPLFLRLRRQIEVTATFKWKKQDLVSEGYDPAGTPDHLYFNDPVRGAFVRFDTVLYEHLQGGDLRL
jgi:fatty-acyl-CoA synthase